jgi:hypothetical protein
MKKFMIVGLILTIAGSVFAENGLTVGGDAKTGLNISKQGDDDAKVIVRNSDDIVYTPGRFRLNFNYTTDNVQVKWRMQMTGDSGSFKVTLDNVFAYAYAMGDFFDKQFRVSVGKIGADHPFETSGDQLRTNVEDISGARFEFKPAAVAGFNVALLMPALSKPVDAGDYFSELGFGLRYENDALDARFAIRLDGEGDPSGGAKAVWRLNAKAIRGIVPGLSVWANGKIEKIKTHDSVADDALTTESWLYAKYAQGKLTSAAIRLGLETWGDSTTAAPADGRYNADYYRRVSFYIKPVFGYKLTDWAEAGLTIRANLDLAFKDDHKVADEYPSTLDKLIVEPSVNFTFPGGFSIKPVYTFTFNAANGLTSNTDAARIDHTFELRFVYSF